MSTTTFQIINGDVVLSAATGRPALLTERPKLRQDLKCMMATAALPDNIGAGLEDVINGDPTDATTVRALVAQRIRSATATLIALQDRYQRGSRSANERLSRLTSLVVAQVEGTMTDYAFEAHFASAAGEAIGLRGVLG